ncbi:UNVERIFIED_CONTAM: hypothetical protein RMT77_014456 [Armadillidium vulgare]
MVIFGIGIFYICLLNFCLSLPQLHLPDLQDAVTESRSSKRDKPKCKFICHPIRKRKIEPPKSEERPKDWEKYFPLPLPKWK